MYVCVVLLNKYAPFKKVSKEITKTLLGYSKFCHEFLNLDHCFDKDIESVNIYFALFLREGKPTATSTVTLATLLTIKRYRKKSNLAY